MINQAEIINTLLINALRNLDEEHMIVLTNSLIARCDLTKLDLRGNEKYKEPLYYCDAPNPTYCKLIIGKLLDCTDCKFNKKI